MCDHASFWWYNRTVSLPPSLHRYFWNRNPAELDPVRHKESIIETLLEHGDVEACRWMLHTYRDEEITGMLRRVRSISPKTRNFWAVFFHIDLPRSDAYERSAWRNRNRP
ncbi:MAG: hypothetical protein Greene041619_1138 [Candidatus Peregrinibacteria bacterium Greene0416_19]|nr:MAG: hypothetical protein Greene041619_1138 [Candidatus Peregrinibacteria bacterium Greene0416_19]